MQVLTSRLLERELEQREAERAAIKGEHVEAGWGNQIRSYVLQPYRMVKDLRTGVETSDTTSVLDGDIDEFITAYLRSQVGQEVAEGAGQ
jgi:peptide chain release factor 2